MNDNFNTLTRAGSGSSISSEDEKIDLIFMCKLDRTHNVANILSTVNMKKDTFATITINSKGMKFTVEESKTLQANVFLQQDLFQQFNLTENNIQFRICLSFFLDCLNIFGSSANRPTTLQMLYRGYGNPLMLILTEGENANFVTDVSLNTMESEGLTNFNFHGYPIYNKVIMQSSCLKEAFNELDWSSPYVNLVLSPDPPYFRLQTSGTLGSCQVDYPKDSEEVFESFQCEQTQANSYKLELLQPSIKTLNIASKTQVRMNQRGILCLQNIIKTEGHSCLVDFFILPSEDDSDNEMEM